MGEIVTVSEDLRELVPVYLNNVNGYLEDMRSALSKDDYDAIRITGHGLKGSGAGYGFPAITKLGKAIEDAARERNINRIAESIADLDEYVATVEVRYEGSF